MDSLIARTWWGFALRGVAAIVLGILAFVLTKITLALLIILFGIFLLVSGVFGLVVGALGRSWWLLIEGVLGVVAGILALLYPGLTLIALALIIGAWAILTGVLEIAAALVLRRVIANDWTLALGGGLSIIFGILVAAFPRSGLTAVIYIIGAYAILWGILLLALAFRLRSFQGRMVVSS